MRKCIRGGIKKEKRTKETSVDKRTKLEIIGKHLSEHISVRKLKKGI